MNINAWAKRLLSRWPGLYVALNRASSHVRFRTEKRLAKRALPPPSTHPSVLFFTTFRCASVFLADQLRDLVRPAGLQHVDFDRFFGYSGRSTYQRYEDPIFLERAFCTHGFLYGPMRQFRSIPRLDEYRIVLVLRDPRDAVTSHYFSTAFSHGFINEHVVEERAIARELGVDRFVLRMAERYLKIYTDYVDQLLDRGNVLFIRYEDVVGEFDASLGRIAAHIGLEGVDATISSLVDAADFSVKRVDRYQHKRSVTSGDHVKRLEAETRAELNRMFGPCLARLGYEADQEVSRSEGIPGSGG